MWRRFLLKVRKLADLYFLMRMYKPAYNYAYISKKDFQTDEVRNFLFYRPFFMSTCSGLALLCSRGGAGRPLHVHALLHWPWWVSFPLILAQVNIWNIFRSLFPSTLTPLTPFPSEHLAEAAEFAGMFQNYDEFSWKSKQFQEHEALKCLK